MRHLIFPDRNQSRLVSENVGALQDRIAQKAISRQVALFELFLLILVARHPLEPAQRRHHGQQQVQLGVLRHPRLDEERGIPRADPRCQPVDDHLPDALGDDTGIFVVGGQRVPVGDEEEALVLVLQPHPVLEHAVVVTEVQAAGRPHARQDALVLRGDGIQSCRPPRAQRAALGRTDRCRAPALIATASSHRHDRA